MAAAATSLIVAVSNCTPAKALNVTAWALPVHVALLAFEMVNSFSVALNFLSDLTINLSPVNDIFERLADEAINLARYNNKATLTGAEIQTAVRLLLPGELAKHAMSEGSKSISKYSTQGSVE